MIIYTFHVDNGHYYTVQDDWEIIMSETGESFLPFEIRVGDKLWIAEWFGPKDKNTVIRIEKRVP